MTTITSKHRTVRYSELPNTLVSAANGIDYAYQSPQGLDEIVRMLAAGTITSRIRTTVQLGDAPALLTMLRTGGLRGKAVIRLH
jgi:D-arabinose 1-dehydrogenase-like Zn-dependent alcohol dehydrogenase